MEELLHDIAEVSAEHHVNRRYSHLSCAARQAKLAEVYDLVLASLFALAERLPRIPEPSNN